MSEFVKQILKEAAPAFHFYDRLMERLNVDSVYVGVESRPGYYDIVGTYFISPATRDEMLDNAKLIEGVRFPMGRSYGIKLGEFKIDPSKVDYPNLTSKKMAALSNQPLVIVDKDSNSNGNVLYAIVRDNKLITVYFGKSYIPQTPAKLKVDSVIDDFAAFKAKVSATKV